MGTIERDHRTSMLRGALFPFFDVSEIVFVLGILLLEVVAVGALGIPNGWVIVIGSYAGIIAVGWMAIPSKARLSSDDLPRVRALLADKLREEQPDRFVPRISWLLRWPRNAIALQESNGEFWVSGPKVLLEGLRQDLV